MSWGQTLRRNAILVVYYALAIGALIVAVGLRSPAGVVAVGVVFAAGGFLLRRWINGRFAVPSGAPMWAIGLGLMALGLAVAVAAWLTSWTFRMYVVFAGVATTYITAGQLLADLRAKPGRPARPLLLGLGYAALFAAGAAWVLAAPSPWALAPMLAAVLAAPSALNVLTGRLLPYLHLWSTRRAAIVATVGVAAVAGGYLLLRDAGGRDRWLVYGTVAVFLLVGAIASNTDLDVLAVVALLAYIGSLAPKGVEPDRSVTPEPGDRVLVGIGDSYMSGEGAGAFYEGTNTIGVDQCRRAPTAFLPVLDRGAAAIDALVFVACSGAETTDTVDEDGDGTPDRQRQVPDAERMVADDGLTIDSVLISMGGNDSGFSEIAAVCLAPGDCTEIGQHWLDGLPVTADRLAGFYADVAAAFPGADTVVVPYPIPIGTRHCAASGFSNDEHLFLAGFTRELNRAVRREAAEAGFAYLAGNEQVFEREGLRICDSDDASQIGVNYLTRNPADGFAADRLNPQNWLHNSLHPNERGHGALAAAMAPYVADADRRPWPAPEADPVWRPLTLEEVMGRDAERVEHCAGADQPRYCSDRPWAWAMVQVGTVLARLAVPLVLLTAGCWLVWVAVLSRRQGGGPSPGS